MRNIVEKYKIIGVKNKKYQVFEETINFKEAKYLLNEYKKNMTLWKFKIKIVKGDGFGQVRKLTSYISNGNYNIEFISSVNKLKLFLANEKTSYNERKKKGILITKELLDKKNKNSDIEFFIKHSKKDDLADCFLQCIYYLVTFNKLKLN